MKSLLAVAMSFVLLAASAIGGPIVHSVFFSLKHAAGSDAEKTFLKKAAELAEIPGVKNFQVLKETSPKNVWKWGLIMKFADQAAYDAYNKHPEHVKFVQELWLKEVADFQEVDYEVVAP